MPLWSTYHIQGRCVYRLCKLFMLWRGSHRDGGKSLIAHYRSGNIVTGHVAVGRVRQPREGHRSSQLHVRAPASAAVDRGDEAGVQLTGRVCTVGIGKVVEGYCEMRLAPRGVLIDGDAGGEVINNATDGVDGDTLYCCPGHSIGGGAHHDIIRATVRFKAAVGPDDVDRACLVDLCRGKRATAIGCPLDVVGHR